MNLKLATSDGLDDEPPDRPDPTRQRVAEMLEMGLTPDRLAAELPGSPPMLRVKAWIAGADDAEVSKAAGQWLDEVDSRAREQARRFVLTPTAKRIIKAFDQARAPRWDRERRGMALIFGASGTGKTETAERYAAQQNELARHRNKAVVIVRADGECRTWTGLLEAALADIAGGEAYWEGSIRDAVVSRMPEGGLLIFDEAQNIPHSVMTQMSVFCDQYRIGVAFMGNLAAYAKLTKQKLGQIASRVGGAQAVLTHPTAEDVHVLLSAWKLTGPDIREFMVLVGVQDGGLRYLAGTVEYARKFAAAKGRPVTVDDLKRGALKAGATLGAGETLA